MIDAGSLNRGRAVEKTWLAVLIFFLAITAAGLSVTLAAGPDLRPGVGQPPVTSRPQNPVQQVVAKQQSQPRKSAKIKLHHNAKGDSTWEISGENVEEILRIDRRLRKAFDSQEDAQK